MIVHFLFTSAFESIYIYIYIYMYRYIFISFLFFSTLKGDMNCFAYSFSLLRFAPIICSAAYTLSRNRLNMCSAAKHSQLE